MVTLEQSGDKMQVSLVAGGVCAGSEGPSASVAGTEEKQEAVL